MGATTKVLTPARVSATTDHAEHAYSLPIKPGVYMMGQLLVRVHRADELSL